VTLTLWFIYLLFLHFIADFICQTDKMALGKSKSFTILFDHVFTYSFVMLFGVYFALWVVLNNEKLDWWYCTSFFTITFITHYFTDALTSRANAYLYDKSRHWFFVMIGFDQFIHTTTLLLTFQLLFGKYI
jgi:hypothetical protein